MAKDEGFLLLSEMNDIEETPVSLAIHPHYIGSPEDTGLSLVSFFFFFFNHQVFFLKREECF
jgi:hypothetical protein